MPKSVQPKAKSALHEMGMAPMRADAKRAFKQFVATYEAKYPQSYPMSGDGP